MQRTQDVHVPMVDLKAIAEAMAPLERGGPHDIWGVFRSQSLTASMVDMLSAAFRHDGIDIVIGPEARGFLIGGLVASTLGAGFVPARKIDRYLPGNHLVAQSDPDWENKRVTFEVQVHSLPRGARCLLVDDWYTTGNQGRAIANIVAAAGARLVGTSVVVEEFVTVNQSRGLGRFHSLLRWDERTQLFSPSEYSCP